MDTINAFFTLNDQECSTLAKAGETAPPAEVLAEIAALRAKLAAAEKSLHALETRIAAAEKRAAAPPAALNARLTKAEDSLHALETRIAAAEKQAAAPPAALNARLTKAEDSLRALETRIAAAEQKPESVRPVQGTQTSAILVPEHADQGLLPTQMFGGKKWYILSQERGRKLLLCADCVARHSFFEGKDDDCSWKESYVRSWLNGRFYGSFSVNDRGRILETDTGGTTDKVFLLSAEEAERVPAELRALSGVWWWLRTLVKTGGGHMQVMGVSYSGMVNRAGYAAHTEYGGIRPAMVIKA